LRLSRSQKCGLALSLDHGRVILVLSAKLKGTSELEVKQLIPVSAVSFLLFWSEQIQSLHATRNIRRQCSCTSFCTGRMPESRMLCLLGTCQSFCLSFSFICRIKIFTCKLLKCSFSFFSCEKCLDLCISVTYLSLSFTIFDTVSCA